MRCRCNLFDLRAKMIWKVVLVFVVCPIIYCQTINDSLEGLQKPLKFTENNFTTPTIAPSVDMSDKNDSSLTTIDSVIDDQHFDQDDDEDEEYWTSDNLYASESSVHKVKDTGNGKEVSEGSQRNEPSDIDYKATYQISDRLPSESIQNNNSKPSELSEIENKYSEEVGRNSSGPDLAKTQSKVVISQAVDPTSSRNLFNPAQRRENEFLSKRIDGHLPFSRESQKRVGPFGRDVSSFLEAHKVFPNQISSGAASDSRFRNQDASSNSDLSGKVEDNSFYRPFIHSGVDSKFDSAGRNLANTETLESGIGGHQYTRDRAENEGSDSGYYDSDRQKHPEVTRKVTVVQEKTMRSISRKEEQESSVNIPDKPQGRFSNSDSIILKTQPTRNEILSHPKTRTKEETIILVEGSHIPVKNYGPEDDLFGYHSASYDENPKIKNEQFQGASVITSGDPSSSSHHRILHNNHGNGVSTQFFVSSHPSSLKESQSNVNIPENPYHHEGIGKVIPIGNDAADIKCHHHIADSINDELEVKHEEIDPNQLYVDAHTGQLIKFVTEGDEQLNFPDPSVEEGNQLLKDSQAWPQQQNNDGNFASFNDPKDGYNHHSFGNGPSNNFDTKRKFKIRRTPKITDLPNSDLSLFNKPGVKNNYQDHEINNKNFQFQLPSKGTDFKPDTSLGSFPSTHLVQKGHIKNINNFDSEAHIGTGNTVLCPEHHSHTEHDAGKYGQKLNIGNVDYSTSNSKSGSGHDFKSLTDISKLLENYGQKNGKSLHGSLDQPANVNVDELNFGGKLDSGNFKGSNHAQQGLFDKSKSTSYVPSYNEDAYKKVYFEFPTKTGNQNLNAPVTKSNSGLYSHLGTGNNKGTDFHNSGNDNEDHDLFDCIKSHNHFKGSNIGTAQKNNKGSAMDIRKHPNYRVSLQNLYGFKTPGIPSRKAFGTAKKNKFPEYPSNGYDKGDLTYLPESPINFKTSSSPHYQGQFNVKAEDSPNNSPKGYAFQNSVNNNQFGYKFQKNEKFDGLSFDSGPAIGLHGNYNSHGNLQSQVPHFLQNSQQDFSNAFDGLNKHQQPVEYILVEMDDNNHNHKDSDIESYYKLYENNFKGEQVDLSRRNMPSGHSFVANGNSNKKFQSPNVRYIVDGGKDVTFPLRRLATTGFHMARSVLPLMSNLRPKSVQGNINFGLQFNKRKGLANDLQDSVKP